MRRPLLALAPLLFASGAAALILETVWLRWLRLLLGATAPAVSAVLVAFFAGAALGAALAARALPRVARPLAAYGLLELAVAGTALSVPLLLEAGHLVVAARYDALLATPALLAAERFALALLATLPTAVCLGATLPVLAAAAVREPDDLGRAGGALYAVNTFGGALGVALASFWLPPWLGVRITYGIAIGLSASAGVVALLLARGKGGAMPPRAVAARTRAGGNAGRVPSRLLAIAALSGFGTFAAQVLLVQSYAQVLNQSVIAFGAVLVVVLASLALGAALVSQLERRLPASSTGPVLGAALALTGLLLTAFPSILHGLTNGLDYVGSGGTWNSYLGEALQVALCGAGPVLVAAGLVLPLTFALAGRADGEDRSRSQGEDLEPGGGSRAAGARLGRLSAANLLGAVAGALAAPYLLLPFAGLWGAFLALGLVYALAAIFLREAHARGGVGWTLSLALAIGWIAVISGANPLRHPLTRLREDERLLAQESTPGGVVSVVENAGERLIRTDNHYVLGGTAEIVHEERQGHLPLLLHGAPERVAFVGTATAITAGAAMAHPVESVALVEITPAVTRAAERFFGSANRRVYADPRAQPVLDDARNYLGTTSERFDVVTADLFVPWRAGTGALYARAHFEAIRARLRPGGLFCQWLPLYQLSEQELRVILATFSDVFPVAGVFRGDFYGRYPIVALVGWADVPTSVDGVSAAIARLAQQGETDRWMTDPTGFWSLYVGALAPFARAQASTPRNTDANPVVEFLAARQHVGAGGKRDPIVGLAWTAFVREIQIAARAGGDPLREALPDAARRAMDGGTALQLASALYVAGRSDEAARALEVAGAGIPRSLLAEADPDPTSADVWYAE